MFRKTRSTQFDIFRDVSNHISDQKSKLLNDPKGWHNLFEREIIRRIDERPFEVLFVKNNGRPNAPLKVLLGMMILKEGNGWSDQQLFEECRFNLKVMRALGLVHIDDDIPVESSYYEFRRRVTEYKTLHGKDLIKNCFKGVTGEQIQVYKVSGEKIRLDSKLIQSNIAKATRLDLILEAVRKHITYLDLKILSETLAKEDLELLEKLKEKTTANVTYPLDNPMKQDMLKRLGLIIKTLLADMGESSKKHCLLQRIFDEHYHEVKQGNAEEKGREQSGEVKNSMIAIPELKPPSQVPSSSIQSVHDPQATYRSKGHGKHAQQVSGYHANVTETCDETNSINLITDVEVEPANVSENEFLIPSIEATEELLGQNHKDSDLPESKVKHATTDGGYDSKENRKMMARDTMPFWNMRNHKGVTLRYTLSRDTKGNLQAFCKKTEEQCTVTYSTKAKKYVIKHSDKTYRYLSEEQVKSYFQIQEQLKNLRPEDINIRANVEATIHQVFHRLLKRQKMKYRGLYKCQMYVISRAFWANFRRILKNEAEMAAFVIVFALLHPHRTQRLYLKSGVCLVPIKMLRCA